MKLDLKRLAVIETSTNEVFGTLHEAALAFTIYELVDLTVRKPDTLKDARVAFKTILKSDEYKGSSSYYKSRLFRAYIAIKSNDADERKSGISTALNNYLHKLTLKFETLHKLRIGIVSSVRSGSPEPMVKKYLKTAPKDLKKFILATIKLGGTYQ